MTKTKLKMYTSYYVVCALVNYFVLYFYAFIC